MERGKDYFTHNEKTIMSGGSLIGYITVDYKTLKSKFGQPTSSDGYKSDAEWEIELPSGNVVYIYNWKNGKNYCGASGLPKTKIKDWNVGGMNPNDIHELKRIINS